MTAAEAKEFAIARIIAEAEREHIPLSETEKQMLWWTEVHPEPHIRDLKALGERFDAECESGAYEAKIQDLAKEVYQRDRTESPVLRERWASAPTALSEEDHYVSVLLPTTTSDAGPARLADFIKYIAIAIGIVLVITIAAVLSGKYAG